jgi:N-carbamoylputrescine amidase
MGMSGQTTRVALIQMACEVSTEANLVKAVERVREAAEGGAKLVCLPELFRAQYFCQREEHALFDVAEAIPGPSTAALSEVVREHKLVVIASLFERRAAGLYHNTAAVLDHASTAKDQVAGMYRKMHIRCTTRSFTSRRGTWGFRRRRLRRGRLGRWCAGTSGIRKERGLRR